MFTKNIANPIFLWIPVANALLVKFEVDVFGRKFFKITKKNHVVMGW